MGTQFWLVALSNTLHLLATVIWIGWSALLPLVVAPRVAEAHREGAGSGSGWVRRLPPLAYGALAALGATGMIQMGAHPQYEGMFALRNLWSGLLLVKHLLVLLSAATILYLGHTLSPQLRMAARREALGKPSDLLPLTARFRALAWLNLACGVGVLALTGLMTAIR